jgi:hypothetical protein
MRIVEIVRRGAEKVAVPCHNTKAQVVVAIPPNDGFVAEQHECPICRKPWVVAIATETEASLDLPRGRRTRSLWMREGRLGGSDEIDRCDRGASGWFPVDYVEINKKSQELRERRKLELERTNLAKQRGVHLLVCSECSEVSGLDAVRWQMHHGPDGLAYPYCPKCVAKGALG